MSKSYYLYIVYIYLIIGIYHTILDITLPKLYLGILAFFTFKWIFNYRKCTISRVECLIRRVKKEKGYIYSCLNSVVDLRYEKEIYMILTISLLLILYNVIYKKQYLKYFKFIN